MSEDAIRAVESDLAAHIADLTDQHEVVYEDRETIVYADHDRYELMEVCEAVGHDDALDAVREHMHDRARQLVDYDWSAADPIVVDKTEPHREAERHVEIRLGQLIEMADKRAARGVDYWATQVRAVGYAEWGRMSGGRDRSSIRRNARRAEE